MAEADPERWTSRPVGPRAEDHFGAALRLAAQATEQPMRACDIGSVPMRVRRTMARRRGTAVLAGVGALLLGGVVWATHAWVSAGRSRPVPRASDVAPSTTVPAPKDDIPAPPNPARTPSADRAEIVTARDQRRPRPVTSPRDESGLVWSALQRLRQEGDAHAALRLLEVHRRRFPDGALRAEAEAARIEALVRLGRLDEARRLLGRLPKETATILRRRLGLSE